MLGRIGDPFMICWQKGNQLSASLAIPLFFSQVGDNSFDLPEANVLIQVQQVKKHVFHARLNTNYTFGRKTSNLQIVLLLDFCTQEQLTSKEHICLLFFRFLRMVAQEGRLVCYHKYTIHFYRRGFLCELGFRHRTVTSQLSI